MSKILIVLEHDNYHPADASGLVLKRKGGGWMSQETLNERVIETLEKAIDLMEHGDMLTITIDVRADVSGG